MAIQYLFEHQHIVMGSLQEELELLMNALKKKKTL